MLLLLLPLLSLQLLPGQEQDRQALMRRIETKVQMPDGAKPLEAYDRYYRWSDPDQVIAGFVVPFPPADPDRGCLIVDGKGERPCPPPTEAERAQYRDALARYQGPRMRVWIDEKYLPSDYIADGGCSVVNVRYEVATDQVVQVTCNGFG